MNIESARALKRELLESGVNGEPELPELLETASGSPDAPAESLPPIALGIIGAGRDYRLAVRVIELSAATQSRVDRIVAAARGEAEVRVIGALVKQQPLVLGGSIGHSGGDTGTLAAVVLDVADGSRLLLSNNHVLARENSAQEGDEVIQPGPADVGLAAATVVGTLLRFVELKRGRRNRVDAAVARAASGIDSSVNSLSGVGAIGGVRQAPLAENTPVFKVGRTTGQRPGRVKAVELDTLQVRFSMGALIFDDQIEIERVGNQPFSVAGDSGALILDGDNLAVGLLFGGNDHDLSYANPIGAVLAALKCRLP